MRNILRKESQILQNLLKFIIGVNLCKYFIWEVNGLHKYHRHSFDMKVKCMILIGISHGK